MSEKTIGQCICENLLLNRTKQLNELRRLLKECREVFRDNLKARNFKDEVSMSRCIDRINDALKRRRGT